MTDYLPQDIDLLDFLRTKLGDLSGFATLANELIQNAEDAGASQITFIVTDDNLTISNDSQFSKGDFERMQTIAGGDRRGDEWTIGKFGIGFTSVYQITDSPQLISSGQHWIFRPEKTVDRRIERKALTTPEKGTIFSLPWAKKYSLIRQKLQLPTITNQSIDEFVEEVQAALPKALLFLKKLQKINFFRISSNRNNISITVSREQDTNNHIIIKTIDNNQEIIIEQQGWYLIEGNFSSDARNQYGENTVPAKRKPNVTVAIPEEDQNLQGLCYAYLPTQQSTGFAFHINADFFPSSDRKRISLENDYRGIWNRCAGQTAISAFINNLDFLKHKLGHVYLWNILYQGEKTSSFWKVYKDNLRNIPLIWTINQQWCEPKDKDIYLIKDFEQESNYLPVLTEMGLLIVHPDLNVYSSFLNECVKICFLKASNIAYFMIRRELNRSISIEEAPQWLRSKDNRNMLASELDILLKRNYDSYTINQVSECAIALGHDGNLHPISEVYSVKLENTFKLFSSLNAPGFILLANDNPPAIKKLIQDYELAQKFTIENVVELLEKVPPSTLEIKLKTTNLLPQLFQLLDKYYKENVKARLCKLPIFPSGERLSPLTDLLVPSSFNDPLHIASLVDLEAIGGYREFLIKLGAQELTLLNYVREQVPSALKQNLNLDPQVKRKLIDFLANHLDEFYSDDVAKSELAECLLIECKDGKFRVPSEVYFDRPEVNKIFGNEHPIASISENNKTLINKLFQWLGVENKPRTSHLLIKIKEITQQLPTEENRRKIKEIFLHINQRWSKEYQNLSSDLQELQTIPWLPVQSEKNEKDIWYSPNDIFLDNKIDLFFTQAKFLDIRSNAELNSYFLDFLGIRKQPDSKQVVNHLLTCSDEGTGISYEVYKFLREHINEIDSTSLNKLREGKSIYLGKKGYVYPYQVFWNNVRFQPYRFYLNSKLRPCEALFSLLNVHEYPDSRDAISVLGEISDEYTRQKQNLSEADREIIIECWDILAKGLENKEINQAEVINKLSNKQVVLTDKKILKMPHEAFFKDRPNLADMFPSLQDSLLTKLKFKNQYNALKAAGVRPLSRVVKIELINKDSLQPIANDDLCSKIRDRKHLIKRVVVETHLVDKFLNHFYIFQSQIIKLRYSLNLSSKEQTEEVLTYLETTGNQFNLYYRLQNNEIPWAHIAREIAYALDLDAETGQVASALKEVISAESCKAASDILDALGFAPGTEPPNTTESPQSNALITKASESTEIKEKSIAISDISKASNIAKSDSGTSDEGIAIEIGRWAKEEAKKFYLKQFNCVLNYTAENGFDFLGNCQGLSEIKVQVKAITFDRPNIRLTISQWTAMVENQDSYELLIISHNEQKIQEIIRIRKAWESLVYALSQLKTQLTTSESYRTQNIEVLIGFQQNSNHSGNDVLLNWHRLIKVLPQENVIVIKYS